MTREVELDTLLVVVGTEGRASVIRTALSARGIASQARRDVAHVIEFGNELGGRPFAVYVRGEDLGRAREVLVDKKLPGQDAAPAIRSG
jgi:hypothetical protein